ncbi:hypothetical protein C4J81_15835 [Deltaproteobacteria bacterium Smac51]|nr:hypothetical protein C4J81_15835 [Deltaproteobacteria bacterium Smac51]
MKMPPPEKIPEAYSAIADNRIEMGEGRALIKSTDGKKIYLVEWLENVYSSNDNATYWQGYPGYPVIAVLMLQNRLPLNPEDAARFKGVNWSKLNKAHKNNYTAALEEVMNRLKGEGVDVERLNQVIAATYEALAGLNLDIKRGKRKTAQV